MPCTYKIDQTRKLILLESTGSITADEIIDRIYKMLDDPAWIYGCNIIDDFSDADMSQIMPRDLLRIFYIIEENSKRFGPVNVAYVSASELSDGMVRMWEMSGAAELFPMTVFRNRTDAMQWLGLLD